MEFTFEASYSSVYLRAEFPCKRARRRDREGCRERGREKESVRVTIRHWLINQRLRIVGCEIAHRRAKRLTAIWRITFDVILAVV